MGFDESLDRVRGLFVLRLSARAGCCVVWWALFLHGRYTELLLFPMTKLYFKWRLSEISGINLLSDIEDELGE